MQKLLERDARGGTRYTEIIRSHFGVISPDARLQRPEYLGGSSVPVNIAPVAQTSASAISGSATPQGNLAAIGTCSMINHGFTKSFTEHGVIIGMVSTRADLNANYVLLSRGKRHDYFTSCLPWPQKGPSVTLPLGSSADVKFRLNASSPKIVNSAGGAVS